MVLLPMVNNLKIYFYADCSLGQTSWIETSFNFTLQVMDSLPFLEKSINMQYLLLYLGYTTRSAHTRERNNNFTHFYLCLRNKQK